MELCKICDKVIYFLLRENPTVIVNAAPTVNTAVVAKTAPERLTYAKLRSKNAGRRRRIGQSLGAHLAITEKRKEPIWESYF